MTSYEWKSKIDSLEKERDKNRKEADELRLYSKQVKEVLTRFSNITPNFKKVGGFLEHVIVSYEPIDEGYLQKSAEQFDKCINILNNYIEFLNGHIEVREKRVIELNGQIQIAYNSYNQAKREEQEALKREEEEAARVAASLKGANPPRSGGSSSGGASSTSGSSSSAPSAGSACFTKGTKVLTKEGKINIEDIKEGILVLTYNEKTKENEYKNVLKLLIHDNKDEELFTITFDNYSLDVTASHRFYIDGNWKEAKDLKIDDELMYYDNTLHKIKNITSVMKNDTYYNLEVEDNHNYYVSEKGVLVHNKKMIE